MLLLNFPLAMQYFKSEFWFSWILFFGRGVLLIGQMVATTGIRKRWNCESVSLILALSSQCLCVGPTIVTFTLSLWEIFLLFPRRFTSPLQTKNLPSQNIFPLFRIPSSNLICFCSRSFPSFPFTKYQKCKGIKQYMSGSLLPYFVKFELFELALLGLLPQWDTRVMWANWKIQESSQKPSPAESNNTLGERLVKIVSGKNQELYKSTVIVMMTVLEMSVGVW